jgi:hypothetical protein
MGRGNGGLFNDLKNFLDEGAIHNGRAGDRGLAEKERIKRGRAMGNHGRG